MTKMCTSDRMADGDAKKEYWRWAESGWVNSDVDLDKALVVTLGVDVGSISSQAVIIADGSIYAYSNTRTGANSSESARKAVSSALEKGNVLEGRIDYCVGTGYGRVNVPMAKKTVSEIICHARGANYIYGSKVRTVLDVGGQDVKVIRCDERGKVLRFLMNDKCAAGTGRSIEVLADLLGVEIEEVGARSLQVDEEPKPISSTCVVFAKSEALSLVRKGWPVEKVLAAYCRAMVEKIYTLIQRVGLVPEFAVTGGVSKNIGIMSRLAKRADVIPLAPNWDTQIAGALGAALIAEELFRQTN